MKSEKLIKYQLAKLGDSEFPDKGSHTLTITCSNGVYEELVVEYDGLLLECEMEWKEGSFDVEITRNELKELLSKKPFHEWTSDDILEPYPWNLDETKDGTLKFLTLEGTSDQEKAKRILSSKLGIEADKEEDFENTIYKIYTGGIIENSDYRFEGLHSAKTESGFYVNRKYWKQDLDYLSNLISNNSDIEIVRNNLNEYTKWEESEQKLGRAYFLLGRINYRKEEWGGSVINLNKAIGHGYKTTELYTSLGWAHRKQNDIESSIEAYEKATQLDKSQSPAFYMLGVLKAHKGQSDDALEAYSKTVELNPEHAFAFMRRGDLFFEKGKLENAKSDFQKCNSIDDTIAYSFYRLGLVNKELKEFEKSARNLDKALHLNENMQKDDGIWAAKGWCEVKSKQYGKAIESYSKALQLEKKSHYYYWRGNSYFEQREFRAAIADYTSSIELNPSNKFSHYKLGLALNKIEEFEKALIYLDKAVEIDQNYKWAYYQKGIALKRLKKHQEAIVPFDKAISLDSKWIWPLIQKGRVYLQMENAKDALSTLKKALEVDSSATFLNYEIGVAQHLLGDYDEALKKYETVKNNNKKRLEFHYNLLAAKAEAPPMLGEESELITNGKKTILWKALDRRASIKHINSDHTWDRDSILKFTEALISYDPSVAESYYTRAYWYDKLLKPTEDILESLEKSLKLDPNYVPALVLYGKTHPDQDTSIEYLKKAVNLEPGKYSALYNLALKLMEAEKYEEALRYFEKAINIKSGANALEKIGKCYLKVGEVEDAITTLKKAVESNKYLDKAYYYLSKSYVEKGAFDKAEESIRTAIRRSPNNSEYILFLYSVVLKGDKSLDEVRTHAEEFLGTVEEERINYLRSNSLSGFEDGASFFSHYPSFDPNLIAEFISEANYATRVHMAKNSAIGFKALHYFIDNESFTIVENAVSNPATKPKKIEVIISEDDGSYLYSYKLLGAVKHPSCTDEMKSSLLDHPYRWVRREAAIYLDQVSEKILSSDDRYVLEGLKENKSLDSNQRSIVAEKIPTLDRENTTFSVPEETMSLAEVVAGEVEMSELVSAIAEQIQFDSWSDYTRENWFEYGESTYGAISAVSGFESEKHGLIRLPRGMELVPDVDAEEHMTIENGELVHHAVSFEAGDMEFPDFELEMEFRPEHLQAMIDDENYYPVITGYEYNSPYSDEEWFEIEGEPDGSRTKDTEIELFIGTERGVISISYFDDLRSDMSTVGLDPTSTSDVEKYIKSLISKKTITIDQVFKLLFNENWKEEEYPEYGTLAFEIKNDLYFEAEVSVELAEWIENEGLGCDRPNRLNEDDEKYNPEGKETIRVFADSYIDQNFKKDFLGSFYDEDVFLKGSLSKEGVEEWIESSIDNALRFFNNFTVASIDENYAPGDLYLNLEFNQKIILEDLNPDWNSGDFIIIGKEDIPKRLNF